MNFSVANMLGEIERIVSFGIRRPGYDEDLRTEQHLLDRFNELGLSDTRLEPVPVNYWQPVMSRLEVGEGGVEVETEVFGGALVEVQSPAIVLDIAQGLKRALADGLGGIGDHQALAHQYLRT